jgi:hypothetical protein
MQPCEYAMPFVVCPRGRVSPIPPRRKGGMELLTGARSGMNRSPMTRISLEVMLCWDSQEVAFLRLAMRSPDVKACHSEAWHSSYATRLE